MASFKSAVADSPIKDKDGDDENNRDAPSSLRRNPPRHKTKSKLDWALPVEDEDSDDENANRVGQSPLRRNPSRQKSKSVPDWAGFPELDEEGDDGNTNRDAQPSPRKKKRAARSTPRKGRSVATMAQSTPKKGRDAARPQANKDNDDPFQDDEDTIVVEVPAEASGSSRSGVNKSKTVPRASSIVRAKPSTESSGVNRTGVNRPNTVQHASSSSNTAQPHPASSGPSTIIGPRASRRGRKFYTLGDDPDPEDAPPPIDWAARGFKGRLSEADQNRQQELQMAPSRGPRGATVAIIVWAPEELRRPEVGGNVAPNLPAIHAPARVAELEGYELESEDGVPVDEDSEEESVEEEEFIEEEVEEEEEFEEEPIPEEEFFPEEEEELLDPTTKVIEDEDERILYEVAIKKIRRAKGYNRKPIHSDFQEGIQEDVNRDEYKKMVEFGGAKTFKADESASVVLPNDFKYKVPDPENKEDVRFAIEKMMEEEHRLATKQEDEVRYSYHRGKGREGHWETPEMGEKDYDPYIEAGAYFE